MKNQNLSINMAVKLMGIKEYDGAQELLDIGYETLKKAEKLLPNNIEYYYLNSALVSVLKGKEPSEQQKEQLNRIANNKKDEPRLAFGACALLGKSDEAEILLRQLIDTKSADELASAPIMETIREKLTDETVLKWLNDSQR